MLPLQHFLEKTPAVGMVESEKEFAQKGGEIYRGNVPDAGREHH